MRGDHARRNPKLHDQVPARRVDDRQPVHPGQRGRGENDRGTGHVQPQLPPSRQQNCPGLPHLPTAPLLRQANDHLRLLRRFQKGLQRHPHSRQGTDHRHHREDQSTQGTPPKGSQEEQQLQSRTQQGLLPCRRQHSSHRSRENATSQECGSRRQIQRGQSRPSLLRHTK